MSKKIKFGEVRLNDKIVEHINDCMERNYVTMGPKTEQLEAAWSKLFDVDGELHTAAVNSGTSACMAAVMSLYDYGAMEGDEVITPALSFIATSTAIRAAGMKPVWVDVDPSTLLIDCDKIEKKITERTRAIMPVALMGKPPQMDVIEKIAKKYKLKVILDNCEGHGCRYAGRFMEDWADMVTYSCYAAHVLFSGEFGFVTSRDRNIAELVKSIRSHGRKPGTLYFDHVRYGLNLKPTDLHAAIGLGNVGSFWDIYNKRKSNLNFLWNNLDWLRQFAWFSEEDANCDNSPHGFSMTFFKSENCEIVKKKFDEAGIEWKRNFGCIPMHKAFNKASHLNFPGAYKAGKDGIHIGVHQYLTDDDLKFIVSTLKDAKLV